MAAPVRNDVGYTSEDPCGTFLPGLCSSGDYASWFRRVHQIALVLRAVSDQWEGTEEGPPIALWLGVVDTLAEPKSFIAGTRFWPSDKAFFAAALAQNGADFLESLGREDDIPEIKATQEGFIVGGDSADRQTFAIGVGAGVVGLGLAAATLYYVTR